MRPSGQPSPGQRQNPHRRNDREVLATVAAHYYARSRKWLKDQKPARPLALANNAPPGRSLGGGGLISPWNYLHIPFPSGLRLLAGNA